MKVEQRGSADESGKWQARIRDSGGRILGAGVLLGGKYVLTCLHVVCPNNVPVHGVRVDFPAVPEAGPTAVDLVDGAWFELGEHDARDVALLRLKHPRPSTDSERLGLLSVPKHKGELRVRGPAEFHQHEQNLRLRPLGRGGPGLEWVELEVGPGPHVRVGFSGGPVFCRDTGMVLGIVVAKDQDHRRAWMIPVETIRKYLPKVDDWTSDHPQLSMERLNKQLRKLNTHAADTRLRISSAGWSSPKYQQQVLAIPLLVTGLKTLIQPTSNRADSPRIEGLQRTVTRALNLLDVGGEVGTSQPPETLGPDKANCRLPGCVGRIEETGFCDTCFRRPNADESQTTVQVDEGSWKCAGLVPLPKLKFHNASGPFHRNPQIREDDRTCAGCGGDVDRSVAHQERLGEGYCPRCRRMFSFVPQLRPDDVVGRKYSVLGYLTRGGFGWIYLAKNREFSESPPVVLKALINQHGDGESMFRSERQYLMLLKHTKMVRASDFFRHADPDARPDRQYAYIVMEYVKGVTLENLHMLPGPLPTKDGDNPPPPIVEIMAYGCEILEVFEYVHGMGLRYTDMTPSNVIRGEEGIHIIDLGSVRQPDDPAEPVLTPGFCAPEGEAGRGRSVQSDLYSVARTLEVLKQRTWSVDSKFRFSVDSFQSVLDRALHEEPELRFGSAREMAEQLEGVLRETLSLHDGESRSLPSEYFSSATELQDDGLGAAPPLATWTEDSDGLLDFGRPQPSEFVRHMPPPKIAKSDRRAAELARFSSSDPSELKDFESVEGRLLECRLWLAKSDVDGASECIEKARKLGGAAAKWRIDWHVGLVSLFGAKFAEAARSFEAVSQMLPGEAAPKVAIGYCLEHLEGGAERSKTCYEAVWRRDNGPASAAFGLARLHLAASRRDQAVEILSEVQKKSKHYSRAQVAAIRARLIDLAGESPLTATDFREVLKNLANLRKQDSHRLGDDEYHRLVTWVQQKAFDWLGERTEPTIPGSAILGDPPSRKSLRPLLEQSFVELTRQASKQREHDVLMDLKNRFRPLTSW